MNVVRIVKSNNCNDSRAPYNSLHHAFVNIMAHATSPIKPDSVASTLQGAIDLVHERPNFIPPIGISVLVP